MVGSLSRREQQAVQYYDDTVRQGDLSDFPVWVDGFSQRVFLSIGPDDEVIDIGCRLGRFVPLLPQLGIHKYFGIDPSVESIEYCRRTHSDTEDYTLQFEVSEARLLGTLYPNRFAGFILTAVIMHIPREELSSVLTSIRACLKMGATGLLSTPAAYNDEEKDVVNMVGMEISLYTPEELIEAFQSARFDIRPHISGGNMILGHVVAI